MAVSNTPRVDADTRKRYTHQAYDVTYGGANMEAGGVSGYGRRASATYQANFQVTIDATDTDPQYLMLPSFVYCNKLVVVEGGGGSPVCDIAVADPADIAGTATQIAWALDISSASAADVALTANVDVEAYDQVLEIVATTPGT